MTPWRSASLQTLLEHSIGGVWGSPPGSEACEVRVLRVTELAGFGELRPQTAAHRSVSKAQLASRKLRQDDLLLEKSGGGPNTPVGRVGLVPRLSEESVCSNFMQLMRPRVNVVDPRFLHLYLNHLHAAGATVPLQTASTNLRNIKMSDYAKLAVPVPEIFEQRRIVAILDEHLSDLDDGMASLNRARTRSTAFLAAAVADEFDRLPGGERLLGDLAEGVKNGIFVSRAKAEPDGVPILRIGAVRPLRLDLSDLRYSAQSAEALAAGDALLAPGDVLFTRYNGNPRYVGACAVVPNGIAALTWPDKLIRVRLRADTADPGFVAYACSFGRGRRAIEASLKTSAGQVGISGRELRNIRICVPHLAIQREVGERLSFRAEDADRLERAAEASGRRANSLRRAVLAAAFSGRLTGQGTDTEHIEELAEEEPA